MTLTSTSNRQPISRLVISTPAFPYLSISSRPPLVRLLIEIPMYIMCLMFTGNTIIIQRFCRRIGCHRHDSCFWHLIDYIGQWWNKKRNRPTPHDIQTFSTVQCVLPFAPGRPVHCTHNIRGLMVGGYSN